MRRHNFLFFLSILALSVYALNVNIPFGDNGAIRNAEASEKVKDLICGMEIDKDGAKVSEIDGKNFYFCSDQCKASFDENPGKVTCLCFVGLEAGDDPCGCKHCSGKGGKCKCGEGHGHGHEGHDHSGHGHGHEGHEH